VVAGGDRQIMLHPDGANPDVVLRNRAALGAQLVLDPAVLLRSERVAAQYGSSGGKFVDTRDVRFGTPDLRAP
jgi:hypothetical protein